MLKQKIVKVIRTVTSNSIDQNGSFDSRKKQQTIGGGKRRSPEQQRKNLLKY